MPTKKKQTFFEENIIFKVDKEYYDCSEEEVKYFMIHKDVNANIAKHYFLSSREEDRIGVCNRTNSFVFV